MVIRYRRMSFKDVAARTVMRAFAAALADDDAQGPDLSVYDRVTA